MMKKLTLAFLLMLYLLFSFIETKTVSAETNDDYVPTIIYIDQDGCLNCREVKDSGVLDGLRDAGIIVIIYDVYENPAIVDAYAWAYEIPGGRAAPVIYAGDMYFKGSEDIISAYNQGLIQDNALFPLRSIEGYEPPVYGFWSGLLFIVIAGLLDGVNPCAIAMLLMFISMVGFTKDRRILITVSISYIGAIFVTYFIIGMGFLTILGLSRDAFSNFSYFLYGGFALLCLFLFVITFYDFLVTRNQEYGKIKNQLPKVIQRLNKKIMKSFTDAIHDEEGSAKQTLLIIFVPILLGIIVGITEAACTGQIYIAVLASISANNPTGGLSTIELFYILVFNVMFVVPLILIALTAVKARSVAGVANFIRERMSLIKFLTSVFFLLMVIYFTLLLFGIELISFDVDFL
ncbi:cytochrome c biogenesis CcdA family protein [Liberiplasma polymorphum]|uniref:cytochrome c biogenesis CcdA family protein n=1 Tax=Liberiplasma polymorphum TaxID=3374570 RepID=UPI003774B6E2